MTTYFVDSALGNNTNNGLTAGTAWATLQNAVSHVVAGDIVNVLNGNGYGGGSGGAIVLDISVSGSAGGGYITFQAQTGNRPIISSARGSAAIRITGNYIKFQGFEVAGHNAALTLAGANAVLGAGTWAAQPLYATDGIFASGGHHVQIINNQVHDFPRNGILASLGDYYTITGNVVHDNGLYSSYDGSGIELFSPVGIDAVTTTKNTINGNLCYANQNKVPLNNLNYFTASSNLASAAGATTVRFASTASIAVGAIVWDLTATAAIQPNTYVVSKTSTVITLSQAVAAPGVGSTDSFVFATIARGDGIVVDTTISTTPPAAGRTWYTNIGGDGSYVVLPFQTTATWVTGGSAVTSLRSGSPRVRMQGDYITPFWFGGANDPLCTITDSGAGSTSRTIQMHVPAGAIAEQPPAGDLGDSAMGIIDTTKPYMYVCMNGVTIDGNINGVVQPGGSTIRAQTGMLIGDATGPVSCPAINGVEGTPSAFNFQASDNCYGQFREEELQLAAADSSYLIQHTMAASVDAFTNGQADLSTPAAWPGVGIDLSGPASGPIRQWSTVGIPASTAMPGGLSRGGQLLWHVLQQFGAVINNVNGSGAFNLEADARTATTQNLVNQMNADFPTIASAMCILNSTNGVAGAQYSAATAKGMIASARSDAFPAPPLIDLSPTGGTAPPPSAVGAWYATNLGITYTTTWETGGGGGGGGVSYAGRTQIANNVLFNNGGRGVNINLSEHCDVIFNTMYQNQSGFQQGSTGTRGEVYIGPTTTSDNNNVADNILVASLSHPIFTDSGSNNTFTFNMWNGGNAVPVGTSLIHADPLFVAPSIAATANFRLQSNSPAINAAGGGFTVPIDFDGTGRPIGSGYDIGAFELAPQSWVNFGPLIPGTSVRFTGLTPSTNYSFRVVAQNSAGQAASNPVTAATLAVGVPGDTTGVQASRIGDFMDGFGFNVYPMIGTTNVFGTAGDYTITGVEAAYRFLVGSSGHKLWSRGWFTSNTLTIYQNWSTSQFFTDMGGGPWALTFSNGSDVSQVTLQPLIASSSAGNGWLRWVEGTNEPNLNGLSAAQALAVQQAVKTATAASATSSHPVISLGAAVAITSTPLETVFRNYWGTLLPQQVAACNAVAAHDYPPFNPDFNDDSNRGSWTLDFFQSDQNVYGTLPQVITEWHPTLYNTQGHSLDHNYNCYYLPIFALSKFRVGVQGWAWWQLFDGFDTGNGTTFTAGMFTANATQPKPPAFTLQAMCQLCPDAGATRRTFAPGKLDFTVTGLPGPVAGSPNSGAQFDLFQGSGGVYYLYIRNSQMDPGGTANAVQVHFNSHAMTNVKQYIVSRNNSNGTPPMTVLQNQSAVTTLNMSVAAEVHLLVITY